MHIGNDFLIICFTIPPDDINVNAKTSSVGNTFNLPINNPPSEPYTTTWWFNGQPIDLTAPGTKYSVDPTTFSLSIANIGFPEGGIYQVELTVSGANVSDFRNNIVICKYKIDRLTIHVMIISCRMQLIASPRHHLTGWLHRHRIYYLLYRRE